jgi:hypothetical protein
VEWQTLVTTFHLGYDEADIGPLPGVELPPLQIGQHVLGGGGEFYRVIDVWLSFDRHGLFDTGQHVFLERAELPRAQFTDRGREYFSDAE